jgi:predicted enzyme related to lactoylglutathione lyase
MIRGVKFVSIPVEDQGRALSFYVEKLGFRVETDQPMGPAQRWIELGVPGADTRVVLSIPQGQEHRAGTLSNATFWADDVVTTYEQLKARGVEFPTPPSEQPWGTFAIFKDSEGNQFVLSTQG